MKSLIAAGLLLFLIPLQGLLGDYLSVGGIKPDLGFLVIYFTGLLLGNARGAVMGIGIGYISDVLSGGTTLAQMESGLVIGYSAGMIRRALLNLRGFSNLVILFVFSLFHSALIFGLLNLTSGSEIARFPWRAFIIPKGVLDAFLGSVFFWLLMKWSKFRDLFEEKEELGRLFYSASGKS